MHYCAILAIPENELGPVGKHGHINLCTLILFWIIVHALYIKTVFVA